MIPSLCQGMRSLLDELCRLSSFAGIGRAGRRGERIASGMVDDRSGLLSPVGSRGSCRPLKDAGSGVVDGGTAHGRMASNQATGFLPVLRVKALQVEEAPLAHAYDLTENGVRFGFEDGGGRKEVDERLAEDPVVADNGKRASEAGLGNHAHEGDVLDALQEVGAAADLFPKQGLHLRRRGRWEVHRLTLYVLALVLATLPLFAFGQNAPTSQGVPLEAVKSVQDLDALNWNLRRMAQETATLRKLIYRTRYEAIYSSATVRVSHSTPTIHLMQIANDGAIVFTTTTATATHLYIPLSPYLDQGYFYRLDAALDGVMETTRTDANVYFPDILMENMARTKVYAVSVDADGAVRADLWATY